jgi:hypothetical protein
MDSDEVFDEKSEYSIGFQTWATDKNIGKVHTYK